MLPTNNFYVYVHKRISDSLPFYVGKGKGKRAWITYGRSSEWSSHSSLGYEVEILADNLSEKEALDLERETIKNFKSLTYPLVNKTAGGQGLSGYSFSEEHLAKLKKTPQQLEAMRKRATGVIQSEATKKKRQKTALTRGTCNDKNTYIFFSDTDVFIGTRKDFCGYSGLDRKTIRTFFSKQQTKTCKGWTLLRYNTLNELIRILKCL